MSSNSRSTCKSALFDKPCPLCLDLTAATIHITCQEDPMTDHTRQSDSAPEPLDGFERIAAAADEALAEVMYLDELDADDRVDIAAINELCAA